MSDKFGGDFAPKPPSKFTPEQAGQDRLQEYTPVDNRNMFKKVKLTFGKPKQKAIQKIQVGFFFDGTWNNRDTDIPISKETNVAKLYDLFDEDRVTRFKFYLEGVGTGSKLDSDVLSGGVFGRGVHQRVQSAQRLLYDLERNNPNALIDLYIFGFSRGAAAARIFVNAIVGETKTEFGRHVPVPFKRVKFLGLFDTVASLLAPETEFLLWADRLCVHSSTIENLTHLVSRDEKRVKFPLTSIHSSANSTLPPHWEERAFPGVHSDVGGGYDPDEDVMISTYHSVGVGHGQTRVIDNQHLVRQADYLARIPGWAMFDAAAKYGVPWYQVATIEPSLGVHATNPNTAEDPINGWTTFSFSSPGSNQPSKHALDHLKIHPALRSLWEARNDPQKVAEICGPSETENPSLMPYQHDEDTNGYRHSRGIFYGGSV